MINDQDIILQEKKLRKWFTKDTSEINSIIDGFDIGWGGTARWATSILAKYVHPKGKFKFLDVACGYGTFLVELGWRFPQARLFGLNLDFDPPHDLITSLLTQGHVQATLIAADALCLPFKNESFDCVTCFLGLQDILITRGIHSLRSVVSELLHKTKIYTYVLLVDNLPLNTFNKIIEKQKFDIEVIIKASFTPMCRWNIEVGYQAVEMYAKGFLQQHIDSTNPPDNHKSLLDKIQKKMLKDLEHQIDRQGYYNPWGTMQLFLIQNLE